MNSMTINCFKDESRLPLFASTIYFLDGCVLPPNINHHDKKNFHMVWNLVFGMNLHCLKHALVKLFKWVSLHMRFTAFWSIAILWRSLWAYINYCKGITIWLFLPSTFRDSYSFVKTCDRCQRTSNISKHHELPLNNSSEVEIFDVWVINFMCPFPPLMFIFY